MNRNLFVLALLSVTSWYNTCSAQTTDSARVVKSLLRCWRHISHEFAPIYGLEDEEVKLFSKKRICLAGDSISMYSGVYYAPKFSVRKVNAEDYTQSNFDCAKHKMDISADSVFEITILSDTKPSDAGVVYKMTEIIAFDEDFIYVVADGVVFRLCDAEKKVQGRGSN